MNLFKISVAYLKKRKLNTLLNIMLLTLGVGTIVILLLFNRQFEDRITRNAAGIDAVVGAKGSPLQLILSSVYHLDIPTGNMLLSQIAPLLMNRAVKAVIPLALGDSFKGFRIVGTTPGYLDLYQTTAAEGRLWQRELECVIGARVAGELQLKLGDEIISSHGLAVEGNAHEAHALKIVGILAPTGSVVDQLILTDVRTVWKLHHDVETDEHEDFVAQQNTPLGKRLGFNIFPQDTTQQITSLLISYSSPMAAAVFPRFVNAQTPFQAASPAFETARLFDLLGVGVSAIQTFGFLLIGIAVFSIFIALYTTLQDRRYDIAIMRTLGASKIKIFWMLIFEGVVMTAAGAFTGLIGGHAGMAVLAAQFTAARQISLSPLQFVPEELWLLPLLLAIGVLAALIPAINAYRTDISEVLSK
jgi:putative ABC transport system permease protein